jgi:DNA polymerase-3 subunit epsilon/CBS domain-containing protein
MNLILDEVGVPRCKGGVMAGNAAWRLSAAAWRRQVGQWLSRTTPADILNADIFFDALPVAGEQALADDLRADAIAAAQRSPAFLKLMAVNVAALVPPLGWFGRLRTEEDGRIDLKKGGIMPIFAAARILALRYGLGQRSTKDRLEAIRGRNEVPQRTIDTVLEAHRLLLRAILVQQLADIAAGIPPSSRVDPRPIDAVARERLRWALEQVRAVPDLIGDPVS